MNRASSTFPAIALIIMVAVAAQPAEAQTDGADGFTFLRDNIGFEAYRGSLKGAEGVMREGAGNSLDRALLLSRLLGQQGRKTRLAYGRLRGAQLERVVALAWAPDFGAEKGNITPDSSLKQELAADLRDHFWVQVQSRQKWIDMDPTLPGSEPGHSITPLFKYYDSMPSHLQQLLEIEIHCDFNLDGNTAHSRLLRYVGPVSSLLGEPITLLFAHQDADGFLSYSEAGGFSPVLIVNGVVQPAVNLEAAVKRAAARAGGVRPALTVKRLWLEAAIKAPGRNSRNYLRLLHSDQEPDFNRLDEVTVFLLGTGAGKTAGGEAAALELRNASMVISSVRTPNFPRSLTQKDRATMTRLLDAQRRVCAAIAELLLARIDDSGGWLDELFRTRTEPVTPRLLAVGIDPADGRVTTDIISLDGRPLPADAGDSLAAAAVRFALGVSASAMEGELLRRLPGSDAEDAVRATVESVAKRELWIAVDDTNAARLGELGLPLEVRRSMEASLAAGSVLILPQKGAEGGRRLAWWELDRQTGMVIGMISPGIGGAVLSPQVKWEEIAAAYAPGFDNGWPSRLSTLCEAVAACMAEDTADWRRDMCALVPEAVQSIHAAISAALGSVEGIELAPAVRRFFSAEGAMRLRATLRSDCP